MKKYPIVEVTWIDSSGRTGWRDVKVYMDSTVSKCKAVGYLIIKNRKQIVVVQNLDKDNETMSDSTCIPRSCVISIKKLKAYD